MKPRSPIVDPGTYMLHWYGDNKIMLTNLNYFPQANKDHKLYHPFNWMIATERGYFEGTCIEGVVFKPVPNETETYQNTFEGVACELDNTGEVTFETPRLWPVVNMDRSQMEEKFPIWSFDDSNGLYKSAANQISISVDRAEKKCECGAESIGYNVHSTWCVKYES